MNKKKSGSVVYFLTPMVAILIAILIYVNVYMRSVDTMVDNYKTSLDGANLAVTVIDSPEYTRSRTMTVLGDTSEGVLTTAEKSSFDETFTLWEDALTKNVGLTDTFEFSGGTCGWAGNVLASGSVRIDEFALYDLAFSDYDHETGQTTYVVMKYTVENVEGYTTSPNVNKTQLTDSYGNAAIIIRDGNGNLVSTTAMAEGKLISGPTLHTEISFPVKAALGLVRMNNFVDDDKNVLTDTDGTELSEDVKTYINGDQRIVKSSTTSLKTKS